MSQRYNRINHAIFAILIPMILMFLITACGTANGSTDGPIGTPPTSTLDNGTATGGNQLSVDQTNLPKNLQSVPYGYAQLVWTPQTTNLVVTISLTGLVPNSVHPSHIHLGSCTSNGTIKYPLNNVVADKHGNAFTNTVIANVAAGIPASGWYINVHQSPSQLAPIYCGNVANSSANTDHLQVVKVQLGSIYISQFAQNDKVASTVPANGDVNPYGVAVVQANSGNLVKGNILVSNFNNVANLQGTGTTIVQISPNGTQTLFAQLTNSACPDGIGLTTALVELKRGWVIVGSLPAADGKFANVKAGCLIVLNSEGKVVKTWVNQFINGPWDATVQENAEGDQASLFITNVLNGVVPANTNVVNQGSVVRFDLNVPGQGSNVPTIKSTTVIGTGFAEKTDANALVIGPTGVGLGKDEILYVSDTLNNRIIAIPDALHRQSSVNANEHVLTSGGVLNAQLGLTIAPNGNILTVNGGDGNIVEITPTGTQIATKLLSNTGTPPGAGCLFGLALIPGGNGVYFVDDCTNQLNRAH